MSAVKQMSMIALGFVLITGIVSFSAAKSNHNSEVLYNTHIVLQEKGFEPREVTIKKGGTVTFSTTRNKPYWPASNTHPSHTIYSEFDPLRPLQPSETWQFTFDRLGEWAYHDHLRSYYVGTIHVVE